MARDWSTFTLRITVNYPMRAIYEAWAIPSQIERWFLRSAEYVGFGGEPRKRDLEVQAGDGFLWRWHGHLDDVNQTGVVTEANGLDRFAFTFSEGSLVTVAIRDESETSVVELTQSGIPDDVDRNIFVDDSQGWTFYLANLKSVLEGGIDLRNRNPEIKDVINS
jgi:uncharacterized protein YndB with AHSA1/START domain